VLNTKRAYEGFRAARATRRRQLKTLSGLDLVTQLTRYSELGLDYVHKVQTLIRRNHLDALDQEEP
jgi:Bax protein